VGKPPKRGTSKAAAEERVARFVDAYFAEGENQTRAYLKIHPNVTYNTAATEGHRLLKDPKIHAAVEKRRAELRAKYALTSDRVIQEIARVGYFNPRRMFDDDGKGKKLHEIDDDTAAALTLELDGNGNVLKARTPTPAAKNTALEKGVKILRLYDKPPPPPPDEMGKPQVYDPQETARRMAFLLRAGDEATKRKKKAEA
jgi:phage terminase small subunit